MQIETHLLFWIVQLFVLLLGISLGRTIILLRIRKEESRKKELEQALLEKRTELLTRGKEKVDNLDDMLYAARVRKEIDDIIRKNENP